ncbi:cupin domain-containing protein [Desulfatiferula olefinivorans]
MAYFNHPASCFPFRVVLFFLNLFFTGESIFPKGDKNEAYARYFTGTSYLNMLSLKGVIVANVTFEPGCRNFRHIHHKGGQILLATAGRGWYQEAGKPARALLPGDVVNIPPETVHWHGAAKDSWFAHVAIEVPSEGGSNEWLEPVSDEEYNQLK